jgi:hypothetical protein
MAVRSLTKNLTHRMAYTPHYTISARLLSLVEGIAALRERIQ